MEFTTFFLKTAPRCRLQGGKIKLQSKLMFNYEKGVCEKQLKQIAKYSIYNVRFLNSTKIQTKIHTCKYFFT